jgi:hypothetical protein
MSNKRGRPCKLTPEVIQRLSEAIKLGATYELACNYAGVTYQTFRSWMIKGENTRRKNKFFELFKAIKEAEGEAAYKWLALIDKAAIEGSWQAAAWKLERRHREFKLNNQDDRDQDEINIRIQIDPKYSKPPKEGGEEGGQMADSGNSSERDDESDEGRDPV